jgi:hypothetical protein
MIRWCLKRADEKGEIKVRGVRDRRGDRLGLVYLNRSIHSSTIILGLLGMISIEEEWRKLVRLVGGNGGARIFRSLCAAIWPGKGLLNWENSKAPRPPNSTGLLPQSTHSCGCRRWTWPPTGALRARPAICGASGRASVNSGAANQRSPDYVDPFHRKVPESREPRT